MQTIIFAVEKETPGTFRFKEVEKHGAGLRDAEEPFIGTLYVRKAMLAKLSPVYASEGKAPATITIVIPEGQE